MVLLLISFIVFPSVLGLARSCIVVVQPSLGRVDIQAAGGHWPRHATNPAAFIKWLFGPNVTSMEGTEDPLFKYYSAGRSMLLMLFFGQFEGFCFSPSLPFSG